MHNTALEMKVYRANRLLAMGVAESIHAMTGHLPRRQSIWPTVTAYVLAVAIVIGLIAMTAT